ncbi:ABC transporter ATP-binding protein [Clostridium sp. MB05]|uniref:ABC transporter ATP-binding protein n=1 Tax=Clostridium sp. MB05 TaxID=3376682 RepID=UPI0039819726
MPILELKNISKSFGKHKVLTDISLNIEKGQIIGFIGPSGSGKTTLVKTIIGMEKPDKGTVTVFNTEMPNRKILQTIGYMAQSDALYEDLSARDNLIFFANLFSLSKNEIIDRITYLSKLVGLENELNKKVKNYSGGMKRRLSLALALIQNPNLLILDEPTVGIDPVLRISIWKELVNLKNEGKSIIVTTHVMDEAEKCDHLKLIRDGKIIASGSPLSLKEEFKVSTIEEVFLLSGGEIYENNSLS